MSKPAARQRNIIQSPTGPVRWAVVGTGSISEQMASDLLLADNAAVVAVNSRSLDAATQFGDRFLIPSRFDRYEAMLEDPSIDAVYLGTPHVTHHALAKQAMRAGKHVLVEKPAVTTAAELEDVLEAAASSGVFFMEAMWMKFNPAFRSLLHLIESGRLGDVRSVRAAFGVPFPRDGTNRWKADCAGGALLDQGIYPVTFAEAIMGPPRAVVSTGRLEPGGLDLTENVSFAYEDGRFAHLASSMVEFIDPTAAVNGTAGFATVPAPFWVSTTYTIHQPTAEDFFAHEVVNFPRRGHGYVPMLEAVVEAIQAGLAQHPWHTWDDTRRVFALLDEIGAQLRQPTRPQG